MAITEGEGPEPVFGVFLEGVAIENPHVEGGVQSEMQHAPVSQAALDTSVGELLTTLDGDLPDFADGYGAWREAWDKGETGVFTVGISEILDFMEEAIRGNP